MRTTNVPVSAALIRKKAEMIASRLVAEYQNADADNKQKLHFDSISNFKASSGWYQISWIVSIWCLESSLVSIRGLTSHCVLISFTVHWFFFFEF